MERPLIVPTGRDPEVVGATQCILYLSICYDSTVQDITHNTVEMR
jgi:hypothetical protein